MIDDGKSLNLIQRALDRKMGRESAVPHIEPVAPAPFPAEPPTLVKRAAQANGSQPANLQAAAPVQALATVKLNMGVLRRSGMINPELKTSTVANEFRNIKRKVLASARAKDSRALVNNLLMVTSTLPEEGKTFTSMNLALSIAAERDLQVLLIDSDLHRPSIGKFFETAPRPGLSELLSNPSLAFTDVACRCDSVPNLSVVFAGKHVDDAPELIGSTRMRDFLSDVSQAAPNRMVIIDTPPALTTFEPALLAPHAHQTLMVISAQHSGRHQIEKALDSVSACHNIGLMFNKAPKWEQRDQGYYYNYEARTEQIQ
jgi:receptor protein-tyrosine kinase